MEPTGDDSCKGPKLAPFNPSGDVVIATALRLLQLRPADVLYDLGCGDARLLLAAADPAAAPAGCAAAARCVGVEYDGAVYARALARVAAYEKERCPGVGARVEVRHGNALTTDVGEASALFVYLVPAGMKQVKPKLLEAMARGARVVTYIFSLPGLVPDAVELYKGTKIYLYTAAANADAAAAAAAAAADGSSGTRGAPADDQGAAGAGGRRCRGGGGGAPFLKFLRAVVAERRHDER
jgi:hypothetical protein